MLQTVNRAPQHDWYLSDWMASLQKRQTDLVELTGYTKTKISFLANNKQPYNREIVNTIAAALHIQPYELLMHPDDAMRIRRYRDSAVALATGEGFAVEDAPEPERKRKSA